MIVICEWLVLPVSYLNFIIDNDCLDLMAMKIIYQFGRDSENKIEFYGYKKLYTDLKTKNSERCLKYECEPEQLLWRNKEVIDHRLCEIQ